MSKIFGWALLALLPLWIVFGLHAYHVLSVDWRLKFQIEGPFNQRNFRDVSASLNSCLGESRLREGRLTRSNRFFSGWWCSLVGNPDLIVTLNYQPHRDHLYYCRNGLSDLKVGTTLRQDFEISDIEFVENWRRPEFSHLICGYVKLIAEGVRDGKQVLVHCDAGRDRTGAIAALLSAVALEQQGLEAKSLQDAIECDYRRTESLKPYKFGRMANMIQSMQNEHESVRGFLKAKCDLDAELLDGFIQQLSL